MIQIISNVPIQIPPHFVARMQRANTTQLVLNVPPGVNVTGQQLIQQLELLLYDVEEAIKNENVLPTDTSRKDSGSVGLIPSGNGVLQSSEGSNASSVSE